MRVLNVMLGEGRGGIESAFTHYADALHAEGMEVVCCITRDAQVQQKLASTITQIPINRYFQYDPRAILCAADILRRTRPDVILTHGRRAQVIFTQAQQWFGKMAPLVPVLHRPRFKDLTRADHIITVSDSLRKAVIAQGVEAARASHIPNFLTDTPQLAAARPWNTPPVVGVLGRLVPEKGVDLLLDAVAQMQRDGIAVRVRIGGSGPLEAELHAHARQLGLENCIEWLGWVENSAGFFTDIDLFCLPSRMESFGLVMLEAFAHGKPVIATRTSGPCEVIADGKNGSLCDITAAALAAALTHAIQHPDEARKRAAQARLDLARYSMSHVAPQITSCLRQVRQQFSTPARQAA